MVVIMKPTLGCNAACRYCAADGRPSSDRFLPENLSRLFKPFADWLRENPRERIFWIWHGGEPLMMGRPFYEAALEAQREILGPDAPRLRNVIQSNLSLLTPQWIPTLHRLVGRGSIGTSFDVVPGWRMLGPDDRGSARYDSLWLAGADLLRRAGFRYGTVYVVHAESAHRAADLYRYFRNLDPRAGVRFNPLYLEGRAEALAEGPITPSQYGRFLIDLFDAWHADNGRMSVMPLGEWLAAWKGRQDRLCCDSRGSCALTHLGIAPDGRVYSCGRGIDGEECPHGNILEDPLSRILSHPARQALVRRSEVLRSGECQGCDWWELCHGGCPHDALLGCGDSLRRTVWCESRQMLFRHMREKLGPPSRPCEDSEEAA